MIHLKTTEEIAILRECGSRLGTLLQILSLKVKPGITTEELDVISRQWVQESGDTPAFLNYRPEGVKRPFPDSICISINNEIVHGIPTDPVRVLKEGDIVTLDMGLIHEGMVTDSAITVGVGSIDTDSKKLLVATKEALEAGIKAVKIGGRIGDIGASIEKVAREYNLSIAEELAGHGVGFSVHEDPFVPNRGTHGEGEEITPGLVIAIEPMLTLGSGEVIFDEAGEYLVTTFDGSRSAHFEHTVAVTENGVEVLTKNNVIL